MYFNFNIFRNNFLESDIVLVDLYVTAELINVHFIIIDF